MSLDSKSSCPQKTFTQCFWHANGELVCENTVVPMKTSGMYVQFDSFGKPNDKYAPNAYHSKTQFFETQRQPTCKVPCLKWSNTFKQSHTSPPRNGC